MAFGCKSQSTHEKKNKNLAENKKEDIGNNSSNGLGEFISMDLKIEIGKETPTPAAYDFDGYLPILQNKAIGLIVNQTSEVNGTHLVDTLISLGMNIKTIFAPEHGFRGEADAGEHVNNQKDTKTGLPIISLYGKNKKPSKEQLKDIDILVFDIQDVGVRFYTYISTMHYAMEACAEYDKEFMVLDRPNPNGNYVDGPVLDMEYSSFVGMHPIPIVHGLTIGELALMITGERWVKDSVKLAIIPASHYNHKMTYSLPVKPSPNLPNDIAITLYPSLCLFEATNVSIGRGTEFPFQVIGYPDSSLGNFNFIPKSIEGMAKHPKHEGKPCFGIDLRNSSAKRAFTLSYFIDFYNKIGHEKFYATPSFLYKLYGNNKLPEQLKEGVSEEQIRASWEPELTAYKKIRKQYLLYRDFE